MKQEPTPAETFFHKITKGDKQYDIIIRSYAEPIRKTQNVSCFTRVAIMDEHEEWGHTLLPNPVSADEAPNVFKMIDKDFGKFKNPA